MITENMLQDLRLENGKLMLYPHALLQPGWGVQDRDNDRLVIKGSVSDLEVAKVKFRVHADNTVFFRVVESIHPRQFARYVDPYNEIASSASFFCAGVSPFA